MSESYLEFRRFSVIDDQVHSQTGQQDADDFAADFQGLRHFSDKVGEALNLGTCQYASLRESEFSAVYAVVNEEGEVRGGMVNANLHHRDLVQYLSLVDESPTSEESPIED